MSCPIVCKQAKTPESACTCSCGGTNHGTQARFRPDQRVTKTMTVSMGGEVAQFISQYQGKEIPCGGTCYDGRDPATRDMTVFVGYEHDGGLKDAQGKAWWLYYECPECGYQHSFNRIASELDLLNAEVAEGDTQ